MDLETLEVLDLMLGYQRQGEEGEELQISPGEIEVAPKDQAGDGVSGYRCAGSYRCLACGAVFEEGEIYPVAGRFFSAQRAVRLHLQTEHPDYSEKLIHSDSKYNSLTDHQQQLLDLFSSGVPDHEIARRMGITPSTVRHQRFVFREKAKQAKLYLAIYKRAFEMKRQRGEQSIAPVHDHAKMVDERYVVTEREREHILNTSFSSMSPLRLKSFSPKEKKKVVILSKIAEEFRPGERYPEKEINRILGEIFDDFATLRRYLIQYGFMKRTKDCSEYWLTDTGGI